jgi:hypothetical protein
MMRFLRVSLASALILMMLAGTALANTDPGAATAPPSAPASVEDGVNNNVQDDDQDTVIDALYSLKLEAEVVGITPLQGDQPGTLTLVVAGKQVTISYTDSMLEGQVAVGSYVEVKGTTQAVEKIEPAEEQKSSVKTAVVAVQPGADGQTGSLSLMVGGQVITYSADELGLTPEALALITAGAEFKLSTEDGRTQMKISSAAGTVKVEVKEDGTISVKLEDGHHPGKGHEISDEKKAQAEEPKEAARQKAEEAREHGKGHGKREEGGHGKGRR